MNLAILPDLRPLIKRGARALPILALTISSCTFGHSVTVYREIEGCVVGEDPIRNLPNQNPISTLYFRAHNSSHLLTIRALNKDALAQEATFDPGDRISLQLTNTDTSLIPTDQDSRRKKLKKELDDIISKSTSYVIMTSEKVSIIAALKEKASRYCMS